MSRKHGVIIVLGLLLAFVFGVLVRFPAARAVDLVSLPSGVKLQGVGGTLFHGKLDQVDLDGVVLKELTYELLPSCLLGLKLCVRLQSDLERLEVNVRRALISSEISVVSSRLNLPRSLYDRLPNLLVKPAGEVVLRIDSMRLSENGRLLDIAAVVDWQNASVEGEEQVLGNYRADLRSFADGIAVDFSSSPDSLLGLTGDTSLAWQGGYELDLIVTTDRELNPSLRGIIESVARKAGLERYRLKQAGTLPAATQRVLEGIRPLQE